MASETFTLIARLMRWASPWESPMLRLPHSTLVPIRRLIAGLFGTLPLIMMLMGGLPNVASALQMQNADLVSPVTGNVFPVIVVPANQNGGDTLADMGADDDGCRHSSGASEYDYYVATDPTSYFSALTAEWDEKSSPARFRSPLSADFKAWCDKQFNSDLQVDINHGYQLAIAIDRAKGLPPPERSTFQLGQGDISIEKKYHFAIACYAKRNAHPVALAKIALMGAWAIRSRLNLAIANPSLAGGYEEVNDKVVRHIKEGETFSLAKWLPIYRDIFENSSLTNEGYMVSGLVFFGMALRDGDLEACHSILAKLTERLKEAKDGEVMRGLVRERGHMLKEYLDFTDQASRYFMAAIASEEFPRQKLPVNMLVVAECLRREGDTASLKPESKNHDELLSRAMDWYVALAKMPETQPKWRDEFREQGRAPGPDAPYEVQLGWIADRHIAELTKLGMASPGSPVGVDKALLNAILFEGFGTLQYHNPEWKPLSGATQSDCIMLLNVIGKALIDFNFRTNLWPKELGELWERDFIHDRNYVNRFNCPVTGKPFAYVEPQADLSHLEVKTILLATSVPIEVPNIGPRYGAFLLNNTTVWSILPLKPGEVYKAP
jgi:hypothetical protein